MAAPQDPAQGDKQAIIDHYIILVTRDGEGDVDTPLHHIT